MSGLPATAQAVVLARGLGTRMQRRDGASLAAGQASAANAGAKAMMPFARPFIDYVLSALADGGITRAVLVVGPDEVEMREYFARTSAGRRVRVEFAVQPEPRGTADAVLAARPAINDAPFLTLNADNLYPAEAVRRLVSLGASGLIAFDADGLVREGGGTIEPERVLRYALLDVDEDGWLRAIREKPAANDPLAVRAERLVSMNIWSFTPRIFDACALVRPSSRGELELADAVMIAMRECGERFRVVPMSAGVLDLSHRSDVALVGVQLDRITPRP